MNPNRRTAEFFKITIYKNQREEKENNENKK